MHNPLTTTSQVTSNNSLLIVSIALLGPISPIRHISPISLTDNQSLIPNPSSTMELLLLLILFLLLCYKMYQMYRDYEPHLATVLLPYGKTKVFFEYWEYYSWYDNNGNQLWSKRIKRKYLFTL